MKNFSKWAFVLTMILALVAMVTVACGSDNDDEDKTIQPTAEVKEPYKIGAVFAVTGNNSPLGTPEKQTAEMLESQINAAGGINGHPLKVIIYDTESDATKCVTLVNKLIEQDNVLAVIGPSSTGESMALLDTMNTAKTPLISCAAGITIVTPVTDKKWVFKTPQSDALAVKELYEYIKAKGLQKIALITDTGGFGAGGKKILEAEAPNYGMSIVANQTFGTTDTDMTSQVTQIAGTDAQAIICWGTNPGPAIIAKNAADLKVKIPLFFSHGIANMKFIELGGTAVNGAIFPAGKLLVADQLPASDPQKSLLEKYKADFESKYGSGTANTFGGHAYDALMMVTAALKAKGADKAGIRDYIENNITNWPGTGGVFNMSLQDHNGLAKGSFVMIKIVDGKWTWLK